MIVVVTGTGTGVGKTIVSAALCALARSAGRSVAYLKVAQTGVPGDEPDTQVVTRLAGDRVTVREGARYPDPMSPEAAARASGIPELSLAAALAATRELAGTHEVVVVEGAGGLLVRYAADGWGIAALAAALAVPLVVVVGTELGTLNALALTLESMAHRGLVNAGVVIGSWPALPSPLDLSNRHDLRVLAGSELAGSLPAGAVMLGATTFAGVAGAAFGEPLRGLVADAPGSATGSSEPPAR